MRIQHRADIWPAVIAVAAIAFLALGVWIVRSHFEARSYNRLTGSNVTTWDAMFIQCRVTGGASQ